MQRLTLTQCGPGSTLSSYPLPKTLPPDSVTITLNGEPYALDAPLTVTDLLGRLAIDARRVAVEHNLIVLKRDRFGSTVIQDGDQVEIVNFVGGG